MHDDSPPSPGKTARLLIIAGSDSGGGAGIQADIKTASALGVYAATALSAVTAQNTCGVQQALMLPAKLVSAQIRAVLDDIGADAVKIGMLGTAEIVQASAQALQGFDGPVVLDPVMVAKSGDSLLSDAAIEALWSQLLPRATLLTPNLPEAARLLGERASPEAMGQALLARGARAVLMKGGHGEGPICRDLLITPSGTQIFESARIDTVNTHGTGCSLASAIASGLAQGLALAPAVARAHDWLHHAILAADRLQIGAGHGPVHHFHALWP